ncbi:DEAD/DEAH box helicase [Niveispirillum irakense]|uniref:DEAD/DEAH box helicase n=1 Tax=Niveispirillum irakense TaxID=34011 RepID=UPI000405A680|nr:DEAD/DEAH box helicase [Niveispirillum irakense]
MNNKNGRQYLSKSVEQLEILFRENTSNIAVLKSLYDELNHRTTDRSARLRVRVEEVLGRISETPKKPEHKSAASPTTPRRTNESGHTRDSFARCTPASGPAQKAAVPSAIDLNRLQTAQPPNGTNQPTGILAAWIALEALSPQTYRRPEDLSAGDRSCVVSLTSAPLPWEKGEKSRPKRQLYYQVILGAIRMDQATNELVKAFGEDEERGSRAREKAAIAAILVDKHGVPVEENGIAVSSFAWALPLALQRKLEALGSWPKVEPRIIEKLDEIVRRLDDQGQPLPLDLSTIHRAHSWLISQFGLPPQLVEPPAFGLRVYHYFKARNPPEATLLNSFFLGDLVLANSMIVQGKAPVGLRRYLGAGGLSQTTDLFADQQALEKAVAPAMMPGSKWPSPGGHPLVLLQQAAVNIARSELAGAEGVVAVNGPPGTGKTTLLRDLVASCVLDRAMAMTRYDDPETAFRPSGEKVSAGEKAFFHLYSLAPELKGHEILVASSNNKAVENVSRELPAMKAVGRAPSELSYFKSLADLVHGPRDADNEERTKVEPLETWGLIAAVLGNARNRAAFQQSFWWHDDRGFRLYLKAAKGDPVVREITDPDTGKIIERRTPAIVQLERPPSPAAAKTQWKKARARLILLKQEIDAELKGLEEVRQLCFSLTDAKRALSETQVALERLYAKRFEPEQRVSECQSTLAGARESHERSARAMAGHRALRPGLFSRLFRTRRWKEWASSNTPLEVAARRAREAMGSADRQLADATKAFEALLSAIRMAERDAASASRKVADLSGLIEKHRAVIGGGLIDEAFFSAAHGTRHLTAPWIPASLHRKREDLFIAALAVHRAFIDASAQKVLHNLSILMDVFSGGAPQDEAKRKLLGDLWSTLFMVVPVLSTTFASVERMLGDLPEGSIGWLLVDEAGQALPQAAVGAVMRAKRSIIVGDPLQIPPVVTLPERLNTEICRYFRVEKSIWAAPEASSQSLADRASVFQASFRSDTGPRRVGIPLLVHRRCQDPMFGISNRIAYDSQMVHAPGPRNPGGVGKVLGPSAWFNIDGEANSKWSPAEGELVVSMLRKIAASGVIEPDVFIITPFRIVAQELRRRLEAEAALFATLKVDLNEWIEDRVGTIHTVQGREADTVILVLGAPKAAQNGARSWAAGTPNIFNVAVSRAKQNLYVVGSHGAWSEVGNGRELAVIPRQSI